MELTPYVDELQQQLMVTAEAGGEDVQRLAERLVPSLQSASRLVLLDALSAAAAEITLELAPGSVEVRLRGRDPEFVVEAPESEAIEAAVEATPSTTEPPASAPAPTVALGADADTARMTLRLPDPLKARIEDAAGREGLSVNAWLVRNLTTLLDQGAPAATSRRRTPSGGDRFTGWAHS